MAGRDSVMEVPVQDVAIPCDGCDRRYQAGDLAYPVDYGSHECRYCPSCAEVYDGWRQMTISEEAVRQRAFDLWQREMRRHVPLKRMPMDFPPVRRGESQAVVLG